METVEILQKQVAKLQGVTNQAKVLTREKTTLFTKLFAVEQSKASYKIKLATLKKQQSQEEMTQHLRLCQTTCRRAQHNLTAITRMHLQETTRSTEAA